MSSVKPERKTLRIVVADDDANECILFKKSLISLNISFDFYLAKNAQTLLTMLEKSRFPPDFIFVDLHEPGSSVEACVEALRGMKKLKSIPIIIHSESANPKDKDYCYETRASEYFLKALFFLL